MSREMKSYVASTKFSVTVDETNVIEIEKGQEIEFDGRTAVIDGREESLPKLAVALRSKWLRESGSEDTFRPSSAKIKMSGATPEQEDVIADGNTRLTGDERAVFSVQDRKNSGPAKSEDVGAVAVDQDAVPVGRKFNNSAKTSVDISKLSSQDFHKMVTDTERPIQTDEGVFPEEAIERRTAEGISFDNYNVGDRAAAGKVARGDKYNAANPNRPESQIVGSVSKRGSEAVPAEGRVVEGSATVYPVGSSASLEVESDDDLDVKTREGRYAIARTIHPDLPEWDFSAHWKKKMTTLKEDLSEDRIAIRAIYAAESEALKKRIKAEFNLD